MRPINRINPLMSAAAYKTYKIVAPVSTHFRKATCDEVECPPYKNGWKTTVDERVELGQSQAYYIRKQSGRKFKETRTESGLTEFEFEPGQKCFASEGHRIRLEREEIFLVKDGDFRGNPRNTTPRRHQNADDWRDDFATHQDKINDEIQKG